MADIFSALSNGTTTSLSGATQSTAQRLAQIQGRQLSAQLSTQYNQKLARESKVIQDSYTSKINYNTYKIKPYEDMKQNISDAKDVVSNSLSRIEGMLNRIETLRLTVNNAEQAEESGDYFDSSGYAAAFDSILNSVRDLASNTRTKTNLLASNTRTLEYPTAPTGSYGTIQGLNVESDYYIVDQDGKRWQPNYSGDFIRRYDTYPDEETSTVGSFDSIVVDSISGDDIEFTIGSETASPQTFTGTIYRKGIGVLDSWLYSKLDNDTTRTTAKDDLEAAEEVLKLEKSRYEAALTVMNYYQGMAENVITESYDKNIELQVEMQYEIDVKKQAIQQQLQSVSTSLAHAMAQRSQYANMFARFTGSNPLMNTLMNISV